MLAGAEIIVASLKSSLLYVDCELLSVTASSVSLKWTRPFPQFSVYEIKYAIQVTLDSFDEDAYNNTRWVDDIADPDQGLYTTHKVMDLETEKYYVFRVIAKTPYKDGWIYSNTIRAKPSLQPLPVQNLRVIMVTLDLVKISWENLLVENTITHVKVTWSGKDSNGVKELDASKSDFNLSGLVANEPYIFRVQARNWNVIGYEAGVNVTGVPQSTPPPPLNPRLIQYYADGVELQWERNPVLPTPDRYQIQCRVEEDPAADYRIRQMTNCVSGPASQGAHFVSAAEVDASSVFSLVQGIQEGYTFQFRICAVGTNYQGAIESTCSDYLSVRTGPPPLPSTLAVASVTTASITLSWTPDPLQPESWSFMPGKDQPLYDISCPGGSVDELKAACNQDGGCIGFSTTGCLKSDLGFESTWVRYSSPSFAKGTCCISTGNPAGCLAANVDLTPKPVCGCQCKGMFRKNLQFLLQMSEQQGPFANVQISANSASFGTRISKPISCASCEECPSSCAEVKGLKLNTNYQFRLYTRGLNGLGYAGESSNLVRAIPSTQPVTAVNDLRLLYTTENRAQLAWTGITTERVTQYRVLASLDGVKWKPDPPFSVLDFVDHQEGEIRGGAGLLIEGTRYYLKVEARNLNSLGYQGVPGSNVVEATPYGTIGPVLDLRATESSMCTDLFCCPCCETNLCRGIGTVTLTWKAPSGPVISYRVEVAQHLTDGSIGSFSLASSVGPSSTTAVVTGLLVGNNYVFKVLAVGTSFAPYLRDCTRLSPPDQLCPTISFAAPYTMPATSVESTLTVVHVTKATITVQWNPIVSEPVIRYQISYGTDILEPNAFPFAEVDQLNGTLAISIGAINGPPETRFTAGLLQEQQSYFVYVVPRNLNAGGYAKCPKSADNIVALDLGDGSYKLTWTAPAHTLPITSYRVWHRLNRTTDVLSYAGRYELQTLTSNLEYTVSGLNAGAEYKFYVIPSAAPCAMIGPITTTNQPNQVRNFSPLKSTAKSVEFSWSPSEAHNGYSIAQKYVLSVVPRRVGHPCEVHNYTVQSRISSTQNTYAFTELQEMQEYCFRIFAENYHAETSGPASYYASKPMGLPYAPPHGVSLVARSNLPGIKEGASVRLTWQKPDVDRYFFPLAAEIFQYRAAYWKKSDTDCLQKFVHINCKSYMEHPQTFLTTSGDITGLEPGTEYYFKVYSGNSRGYEPFGSEPIGPISTSNLPGPVLDLKIPYDVTSPSVTASSVTLTWIMPMNPSPSKLKLMYTEHASGRQVVEERSCSLASPCPSTKSWTDLTTANMYTFTVYTGGPDDILTPVKSLDAYSGVASVDGAPYRATNSPRNLTMTSWSDSGLRLKFLEPEPNLLNGPVLDYFLQGKVGSGDWRFTNVGVRLTPATAGQELSIESIAGTVLNFNDKYSFRVFTANRFGNSTSTELMNITLYPKPSSVPSLIRTPKAAGKMGSAFNLQWSKPMVGASAGIGLEYVLEVSDDAGATFHADIASPFSLESSETIVNFVNKPRPRKVEEGRAYLSRIRPKNRNSGARITDVPAKTLIVYTTIPPGPVPSISVEYVTESKAAVSWQPPYHSASLSFAEDHDLYYDCEVALYSMQPVFWALNATFANLKQPEIAFTLNEVQGALRRAGATVQASESRFLMRVIPRNSGGKSLFKNPTAEVWFIGRPQGTLRQLSIVSVRNGSADISWVFPNATIGLVGFDIRTSADGVGFERNKIVPSTYKDEKGVTKSKTSTTVSGLAAGRNWIQVLEVSKSDVSIGYSLLGPSLIKSAVESVPNLQAPSVTEESVLLRWDLSPTSVLEWDVSYAFGDGTSLVGPFAATGPPYRVTGLSSGVLYTFFVRARSYSGIGPASTVSISTMNACPVVSSVHIVQADGSGNLRIAWLDSPSNQMCQFRVRLAEEDRDGTIGSLRIISPAADTKMRTITGLVTAQRYRFVVETANLHENGFGNPRLLQYTVPSKPAAPTQIAVVFSLNNALIVKWVPATTGSMATYFRIVTAGVTNTNFGGVTQYQNVATRLAEIQGLEPCSLYHVSVSSCNLAGCTAATQLLNQRTAPNQPVGLITDKMTSTSLTLKWSHPNPTNLVYRYYVKYRRVSTIPQTTSVVDGRLVLAGGGGFVTTFEAWSAESLSASAGANTSATLTGLTANSKYQIAIVAQYENIRAAPVFIMGMPADAPQAVEEFKIADDARNGVLSNSLTVMWRAPAGSTITHYDFYWWSEADSSKQNYSRIGVNEANERPDGSGDNYYTVRTLTTFQKYGFQIIPRNLNTGGSPNPTTMRECAGVGDTLCTTTPPTPVHQPGSVQNLRIIASTDSAVTLEWRPPPSTDASFLKSMQYAVAYTTVASNTFIAVTTIPTVDGTTTGAGTATVQITNLQIAGSGVAYYFRIKARNGNSQGYGPDKIITGMPNVPCAPTGCLARNLGVAAYSGRTGQSGSITISWSPPVEADTNPYLSFFYKVFSGGSPLGPEIDGSTPYYTWQPIQIGETKDFSVATRTLNGANSNVLQPGFGSTVSITAVTPRAQPAALTSPPSLIGVSPTSVTLSWPPPSSNQLEYAYKVGWRLAGTNDGFLNPSYSTTTSVTVTGLTYTSSYEFKVFARNLNADGFEGFGSPTLLARPRDTLGPPPNFRVSALNPAGTSVTLSWEAHPGITNALYRLTFGAALHDKNNQTLLEATDTFQATKGGLTLGSVYYFSLRVRDTGGWSEIGYRKIRMITKASVVLNLAAFAIDVDDAGLSWEPPLGLGTPSDGLSIGGYTIDVLSGSTWVNLGTANALRFNHKNITQSGVTYRYRVAALVQQAEEFGYVLNPGAFSEITLFFGTAPIFVGATPPHEKTLIALQSGITYIPLQAYSADVLPNQLTFRCTGALPSVVTLTPAVPSVNVTSRVATQSLAITFVPDLAGSEFYLCMQAQDSNGLRTQARCYTILLPLPAPKWLAPANNSAYEARVGCTLTVNFLVEDRTSSNIDPGFAAEGGFIPEVVLLTMTTESDYKSSVSRILPAGASFVTPTTGVLNPASNDLVWRLRKGQEGFAYRLCFATMSANNADDQLCISVTTARCQYCLKAEDSLQRIAKEWHTTWTEVWSGNHIIYNPDMLITEQIVQVGPIYTVQKDEDLDHIALRYGVDLHDVLLWNPDVADTAAQSQHYVIKELQELCLVPQSCIYSSSISSSPTIAHAAL